MIKHIYVSNYALIKELELDFSTGFTTITGETGAGKSIMLGAFGLVLGNRADVKVLANQSSKCIVEAHFDIGNLNLESFFVVNELDYEPVCIIRREILPSGKSRGFVNDTPVKLDLLKNLGTRLVDIHSQRDNLLMLSSDFQLEIIDLIAQNHSQLTAYQQLFDEYNALKKKKAALERELEKHRDLDYLQFLSDELESAGLVEGEETSLENELETMRHAEDIQMGLATGFELLSAEQAVLEKLTEAQKSIERVSRFLPAAKDLASRLSSAHIELQDIANELELHANEIFVDDTRLRQLEERANQLNHLLQKHHVTTSQELIEKFNEISAQLLMASDGEFAIAQLEKAIDAKYVELKEAAAILSKTRIATAKKLEKEASNYLTKLNLPHAQLPIKVFDTDQALANGFDDIQFYFTANPGSKPEQLKKVASGGELSRVMLALKAILAKTKTLPTIIFDEIDTGVSGETAYKVAEVLSGMGEEMQVLAITHLPQIAAKGSDHLVVVKHSSKTETETTIKRLSAAERVDEVARLLSGEKISDAAKKTAEELLFL